MVRTDTINNYGSVLAIDKTSPIKRGNHSKAFQDQFDSMELAKKASQPNKFAIFDKEKEQTIGGIDLNRFALTYDKTVNNKEVEREGDKVNRHIENEWKNHKSEFSYFAENGGIEYNGVTFQYDGGKDIISLGDMTNSDDILTISLSGGTTLRVNRNQIDRLIKAIGMFKPEDVKKIMDAIAIDSKSRNKPLEVEKEKSDTFDEIMDKIDGNAEEKKVTKKVTKKEV